MLRHEFLERVEHGLGLFGVEGAGARHVVFHQAALQDFGRDELREGGGVKVDGLLHFDERVDHVLRSDDVAQTEARGEHLGHRAHADRAFGRNGAKRDRGTFAEVDFAVGIVFKEPEVVFAGLFAELAAAFLADRAARRILEGRHHVRKARAAAFFAEPVGIEPLVVGLHFDVFGEAEVEGAERTHVGRAFDEHLAAFVEEEAGDHVEALLRTRGDEDFVDRGRNAALRFLFGDRFAQFLHARSGGVLQGDGALFIENLAGRGLHRFDREALRARQAAREADHFRTCGERKNVRDDGRALGAAGFTVVGCRARLLTAFLRHDQINSVKKIFWCGVFCTSQGIPSVRWYIVAQRSHSFGAQKIFFCAF